MKLLKKNRLSVLNKAVVLGVTGCCGALACAGAEGYPHPVTNPDAPTMLVGDWFDHPHEIDFNKLPDVPREHIVINDVTDRNGVNQHNYLIHHDGRFWAMWSDGPQIEDRVGQVVKYATSEDGVNWSEAAYLTDYPPHSGPDSPHYNTRTREGFRYIARGFWVREDGELLALLSLDEAAGFFGSSLKLLAYRWNAESGQWQEHAVVYENAINNFSPKRLPTGEWMMSRRPYDYKREGVDFMIGGVDAIDSWEMHPVPDGPLTAEEPYWWELPDGNLMALFRDNDRSGYLFRSFSTDDGRTWTQPVRTNFPDARSKFHGLRMSDGRYALVSNGNPRARNLFTLAISDDGVVFDRFFHLVTGQRNGVDYPMMMEHDGYLYIAHSGGFGGRKQSVELQRVRIADLDAIEMVDARPSAPYQAQDGDIIVHTGNADQVLVDGPWGVSTLSDNRIGDAYLFLKPRDRGSVTFTAALPEAGRYEVFVWYNSEGSRSRTVPHVVHHAQGQTRVIVDQQAGGGPPMVDDRRPGHLRVRVEGSGNLKGWVSLGTFDFNAGTASVALQADRLNSYVVADAVLFSPRAQSN